MSQSIFQSKKSHFEYITSIMKTNDIQIKDLTKYILYTGINNATKENPFQNMEFKFGGEAINENKVIKEEVNATGPFNKITKITQEHNKTAPKDNVVFGNFAEKSWADDSDDEDDVITAPAPVLVVKEKCWGDDSDNEEDNAVKQTSYLDTVKKPSNSGQFTTVNRVKKYTKKQTTNYKKNNKQTVNKAEKKGIIFNRCEINSVKEYIECLQNHMKPCKFGFKCSKGKCTYVHINPEAECEHTYTGELCPDVRKCDKIHQKRCIYDLDCTNSVCSFKHSADMPTPEAQQTYIESMTKYESIVMSKY